VTTRIEAEENLAAPQQATEDLPLAPRPRTLWRDAWGYLRRSRLAMISAIILGCYVLVALIAFTGVMDTKRSGNEVVRQGVIDKSFGAENQPPVLRNAEGRISPALWFGTDIFGRSVFWRFLYGSRVALTVALLSSILSIVIGTVLGLLAGYFGRWIDSLVIWLFSTVNSIPWILLIIALAFALKGYELPWKDARGRPMTLTGIPTIVIALGATSWVGLCRLIRGEVLRHRERDYVAAARAVGVRTPRILARHILPNVFHLIIIDFSLGLVAFVQAEVILSFLGLGITDQPSWGRMIDDAKLELLKGVWWQFAAATVAIFVFSLAVNILGDALRDALDPRLRGVD
jgi:peptide/nickel transport system permease protein